MGHLTDSIRRHEGWRDKAYQDSEDIWTIGYGRNLKELQIDKALGEQWLEEDINQAKVEAAKLSEFHLLEGARRDVLIEMVYNMGPSRTASFKKMLLAIRDGDWKEAAVQMLDSKWASQVGQRARTLAKQMETGTR